MVNVPEIFGSMVFNDATMKERLPKATYKALKKTIDLGEPLDISEIGRASCRERV